MAESTVLRVRQHWGTRLGVILAVAGSAVGLGNFVRFPGVAASNGGGAFMIPYLICFVLIGLPIVWIEWTLGRYGGRHGFNSAAGIFRLAARGNPRAAWVGGFAAMVPVGIYGYYLLIEAWCLAYAWKYWSGSMAALQAEGGIDAVSGHIWEFSGATAAHGAVFESGLSGPLVFVGICFVLNLVLIARGLNKGIEWFCRWAMPALGLCALLILVRVLTLPAQGEGEALRTVGDGLGFMWNPVGHVRVEGTVTQIGTWQALTTPQTWLAAAGQIFFSLSVGMGVLLTYASYLRKRDDVALSSTAAAAGNGFCEVCLGGLIVIPAAFLFLGADGVVGEGTLSMGFAALPGVFAQMPAGNFFGGLFFLLLFLAAVTSSLSMLQPTIALLEEGLGLGRAAAVALLGFIAAIGAAIVLWFSQGLLGLDHTDFWMANFSLYLLGLFQVILFGWVVGIRRGMAELRSGAEIPVPGWIGLLIKWITPSLLIVIFVAWYVDQIGEDPAKSYLVALAKNSQVQVVVGFLGLVALFFITISHLAERRWCREETDGLRPPLGQELPEELP